MPVAAFAVCADQKATSARITGPTHVPPPLANALDRQFGGVGNHSRVDRPDALADVVNAVWHSLWDFRIGEIAREHFDRIPLWTPLLAGIFVVSYKLHFSLVSTKITGRRPRNAALVWSLM